jgi:hypothetical protein
MLEAILGFTQLQDDIHELGKNPFREDHEVIPMTPDSLEQDAQEAPEVK